MLKIINFAVALIAFTVISLIGISLESAGPNPNKGKSLFKATCKSCHVKAGEAKDLTPMSKTIEQWNRFFKKGAEACLKRVTDKTNKTLTPEEVEDMKFFLVSHAADSDHPETCGGQ
ncbi:cytochrome c [bacterium]|nr:cytochrome c [bacterium]